MKIKILKILTTIMLLTLSLIAVTACGNDCSSHTHEFKNIKHDEINHWYECDCGEQVSSKDTHTGGSATCTSKAICVDCGFAYGELKDHTYTNEWLANGAEHYKTATCGCDIDNIVENHVDNGNGICTVCDSIFVFTQGLKFEISQEQTYAKVVGYEGESKNVVIPNYYNDLPVTTVSEGALYQNSLIESVLMPNTITSIGEKAFAGCTSLKSIDFKGENSNYATIDGSLYTKDNKTLIQYAIGKEEAQFSLSETITTIGSYAFAFSRFNNAVVIPNSVTKLGKFAFKGAYFYSGIQLPTNLTAINEYAFSEVEWLIEIKIPSSVKTIESNAFYKCKRLGKVTFNNDSTLQTIEEYAFSQTNLNVGITLPNSLVAIKNNAFSECIYLSSIVIPSNVEVLEFNAFHECNELKTVTFADNCKLKMIDFNAFSVCTKLKTVTFGENCKLEEINDRAFYSCDSLKTINLPNTLTTIGASAFHFCQSLEEIYIPISVKYMAHNVFYNCHWTTIYCQAESEPEDWSIVWNPSNCTVYWGC